jgi:hypothetical protein
VKTQSQFEVNNNNNTTEAIGSRLLPAVAGVRFQVRLFWICCSRCGPRLCVCPRTWESPTLFDFSKSSTLTRHPVVHVIVSVLLLLYTKLINEQIVKMCVGLLLLRIGPMATSCELDNEPSEVLSGCVTIVGCRAGVCDLSLV